MAKSEKNHTQKLRVDLTEDADAGADAKSARVIELEEGSESNDGREYSAKPVVLPEDGLNDSSFAVIAAWIEQQNAKTPRYVVSRGQIREIVLKGDAAQLRKPHKGELELAIGRDVAFCKQGKDGLRKMRVDRKLVIEVLDVLAERGALPIVKRVRGVPTFTKDGRLLTEPGLDRDSGILLTKGMPVTLDNGSMERALRSLEYLNKQVLEGFRFRDRASRHNFLGLLLLIVASDLVDELSPLGWFMKRRSGEGVTVLAQILGIVLTGDVVATVAEERGGSLMPAINASLALEPPILIIDNVELVGDSAAVESWLTTRHHQFRWYGSHRNQAVSNLCLRVLTTRRARPSVDVLRRSLPVFLGKKSLDGESPTKRVHTRRDFEAWIRRHRVPIVQALIDIVAAWLKAGQPHYEFPGSYAYPRFAAVIGGILHHVGCDRFLSNWQRSMDELDGEGTAAREFVELWWANHGSKDVKAGQLVDIVVENGIILDPRRPSAGTSTHSLGRMLRHMVGDEIGGYRVVDAGVKSGSHSYALERVVRD